MRSKARKRILVLYGFRLEIIHNAAILLCLNEAEETRYAQGHAHHYGKR
jgi:hypothetical protein